MAGFSDTNGQQISEQHYNSLEDYIKALQPHSGLILCLPGTPQDQQLSKGEHQKQIEVHNKGHDDVPGVINFGDILIIQACNEEYTPIGKSNIFRLVGPLEIINKQSLDGIQDISYLSPLGSKLLNVTLISNDEDHGYAKIEYVLDSGEERYAIARVL